MMYNGIDNGNGVYTITSKDEGGNLKIDNPLIQKLIDKDLKNNTKDIQYNINTLEISANIKQSPIDRFEKVEGSSILKDGLNRALNELRNRLSDNIPMNIMLRFIKMMELNNKFNSLGLFISENNREETYIKIIEMGDDSLIDSLEEFINLSDYFKSIEKENIKYNTVVDALKLAEDDEIEMIITNYLNRN